jgi:HAD superfamily hydrolase (TIGR01458 family)
METERVTRIDSRSMAAILLDVDGVFHVSGRPIDGVGDAVRQLREDGHRLRFVTNNTTSSRADRAEDLRALGVAPHAEELATTPRAPARTLAGKRVLALTMAAIRSELEGVELVGDDAEAVLLGGADETDEPNRVFSYMNLARAFAELEAGADLYCLHKNRWWQTSRGPLLDSGAFIAGLEYAAGVEATVLGKPSPAFFGAALDALDADPERTWMVGDDLEADVAGAKGCGLRTILVRTGKFREQALEEALVKPDAVVDSLGDVPGFLARSS